MEVKLTLQDDVDILYGLAHSYVGEKVKVFLHNGRSLSGHLVEAQGKYIRVVRRDSGRESCINLDHIMSLTRQ